MEKFPLRMKDNDLLVTELFRDPCGDAITALSVYLTPRTSKLYQEHFRFSSDEQVPKEYLLYLDHFFQSNHFCF